MSSNEINVYIVVEGTTERNFVREVLAPEMANKGIYLRAKLIGDPGHKGGDIRFDRAKNDIENFLKQRKDTYITTMFDYFRIDSGWPGRENVRIQIGNGTKLTPGDKAAILETAMEKEISGTFSGYDPKNRFIPYIAMHESEALLFSDVETLAEKTGIDARQLIEILSEFNNPEEINDGPQTAPSRRLMDLKSDYHKIRMGKTVSEAIGIQAIRKQCPHFNDWLTKLENLA
ncbi:MAG: DUF4276 family protein [Nitrospirae bacterium]|nr:DUF4276 family protein [Nitrospirota bacterium]